MEIPIVIVTIKDYEAQILPSPVSTNEPTSQWPCSPWWPGSKLPDLASKIQRYRWWQEIRTIVPMIMITITMIIMMMIRIMIIIIIIMIMMMIMIIIIIIYIYNDYNDDDHNNHHQFPQLLSWRPSQAFAVQVVGGLIQDQHVGVLPHGRSQDHLHLAGTTENHEKWGTKSMGISGS